MPEEKRNPLYGVIDRFDERFRRIVAPAIPRIVELLDQGVPAERAVSQAFAELGIQPEIRDAVLDAMVHSAAIGYGVQVDDLPPSGVLAMRRAFLDQHWPGDTVTFSERIIGGEVKAAAINEIKFQLSRAANFRELAKGLSDPLGLNGKDYVKGAVPKYLDRVLTAARRLYTETPNAESLKAFSAELRAARRQVDKLAQHGATTGNLKAIYSDVLKASESLNHAKIEKAVAQAVRDKARANAERIARTEIARAYGESFDLKNNEDPDTIGCKFVLSTRHPYPCICNFWTGANLYGMGPGVYPKDLLPDYPFHPHCLCLKEAVYKGEAVESRVLRDTAAIKLLFEMDPAERKRLMGIDRAGEFEKNPQGWKNLLPGYADPKKWEPRVLTASMFSG